MPIFNEPAAPRMNSIIYGTDFSIHSQSAGFYASLAAQRLSARLLVAYAFTPSQAALEVEADGTAISERRRYLETLLAETASSLATEQVVAVPLLQDGDPNQVLPDLAEAYAPAMLVLGTHGGGWLQRKLIGSVAEQVLRTACCPTLTVGPAVPVPGASRSFHRVLCAMDLRPTSAGATGLALARALGEEVEFLHAVEKEASVEELDPLRGLHAAPAAGAAQASGDVDSGRRSFIPTWDAHEQILEQIKAQDIDLLVLDIEDNSSLGKLTDLSGAFPLIVHARCPVLTITGERQHSRASQ
jgi:nucleotide-binding universal stress UspA family protein